MFHCCSEQKVYVHLLYQLLVVFIIAMASPPFYHIYFTVIRQVHLSYSILGLSCPLSCSYICLFCQIRNMRCYSNAMLAMIVFIIVISFFTSSLQANQFTEEGKAQLRKAKEERDSSFVKFDWFFVQYSFHDFVKLELVCHYYYR